MYSMFRKISIILSLSVILTKQNIAQQLKQTIRGTVIDKITNTSLPGATVALLGAEPFKGVATDESGNFKLTDVPVGKQTLKINYLGYKEQIVPNIIVNSGKEVVLSISMEENFIQHKEVLIKADADKTKPLNEMATVSSRTFSVEESQKFAAAVNDPARMASSFAGVVSTDDGNNSISIRGNSPMGLKWRMEGVEIPNPNHFATPSSSGGGISILSAQTLSNSDFLTAAFPAEYGDALSGVFDLKLRRGNNEKYEHTFQAGLLGIDLATEGPIKKNYKGSYLVNYRYSTLSLLSNLGVEVGDGITNFQDLSFNISAPTSKAGNFTLFGFGGLSSQVYDADKDSSTWEDTYERYNSVFSSNTGAVGLTHSIILNPKTYLRSVLSASSNYQGYKEELLDDAYTPQLRDNLASNEDKYTVSSVLNYKHNARHSIRTGAIFTRTNYQIEYRSFDNDVNAVIPTVNSSGGLNMLQLFAQSNYHLTEKLTANAGLHYSHLFFNNSFSIEPRTSLKYELNKMQSVSLGYGLHSQLQPVGAYFAQKEQSNGIYIKPNQDLEFSKAHHFVLGYEHVLNQFLHAKVETYYQALYNIPVRSDIRNSFSMVNESNGLNTDLLVNKGTGNNYGIDLTLEQFLRKNTYFLLSGSLYDSRYRGSDEVLRSTRYNGNYSFSFTAGKEIITGAKFKDRVLGLNIKTIYRGGFRDTPIDFEASQQNGNNETSYIDDKAFTEQYPAYFRTDVRVSLKRNRPNSTHIFAIDIQNVSNRKNIYGKFYDAISNKVKTYYQTSLIPILSYKIEF